MLLPMYQTLVYKQNLLNFTIACSFPDFPEFMGGHGIPETLPVLMLLGLGGSRFNEATKGELLADYPKVAGIKWWSF